MSWWNWLVGFSYLPFFLMKSRGAVMNWYKINSRSSYVHTFNCSKIAIRCVVCDERKRKRFYLIKKINNSYVLLKILFLCCSWLDEATSWTVRDTPTPTPTMILHVAELTCEENIREHSAFSSAVQLRVKGRFLWVRSKILCSCAVACHASDNAEHQFKLFRR